MPVRIYDISKKLGLENKEVLAKAKELGIAAAKVASSSLDKITAEYLEQQILLDQPHLAPPSAVLAPSPPVAASHTVVLAPPPPPETEALQKPESATATATTLLEPEPPPVQVAPALKPAQPPVAESPIFAPPPKPDLEPIAKLPPHPPPPPTPPRPKLGDNVAFIQLPPLPRPKLPEKPAPLKGAPRPAEPRRTDFSNRGDIRSVRGGTAAPAGPAVPGARIPTAQKGAP